MSGPVIQKAFLKRHLQFLIKVPQMTAKLSKSKNLPYNHSDILQICRVVEEMWKIHNEVHLEKENFDMIFFKKKWTRSSFLQIASVAYIYIERGFGVFYLFLNLL